MNFSKSPLFCMFTIINFTSSDTPKVSLAGYKAMYAAALRGSQSQSGTISEQIQQARTCLETVTELRPD